MLGKAVTGFVSGFMGGLKNSFTGAIPQVNVDTTGVKGSDPNESHYWQFGPPRLICNNCCPSCISKSPDCIKAVIADKLSLLPVSCW